MKVFILPSQVPDVNFALAADGTVLKTFGDALIGEAAELYDSEYDVEIVEKPLEHKGAQNAIACNRVRARMAGDDKAKWAETELFGWQYGVLPAKNDSRKLNVKEAVKKMALGVISGESTRENIAMVLLYLGDKIETN